MRCCLLGLVRNDRILALSSSRLGFRRGLRYGLWKLICKSARWLDGTWRRRRPELGLLQAVESVGVVVLRCISRARIPCLKPTCFLLHLVARARLRLDGILVLHKYHRLGTSRRPQPDSISNGPQSEPTYISRGQDRAPNLSSERYNQQLCDARFSARTDSTQQH